MTDWELLLKPTLRSVGAYEPGESLDELMARHGLTEIAKLNWNEGLWGPLPGVEQAVTDALDQVWAYPEHAFNALREAIAAHTPARPEQVLPGHGIQALIMTLVGAFVRPDDTVVVPTPTYGLYAQASRVAGATVEAVPSPGLRLDLEAVAAAVRRTDARIAWICDPNNPTGSAVGEAEWRLFLDALPPGCVVAADEAYADYIEPGRRFRREDDVAAGRPVVVLRTFSKIFGLAGLRLGYALAAADLVPYLQAVQEPFNVNRPALVAGAASLGRPADVDERRRATAAARDHLAAGLRAADLEPLPSEANFLLVEHGAGDDALADLLLRRGVLVRPGSELGLPGWARITVGPRPLMDRVLEALPAVLEELSPARARAR